MFVPVLGELQLVVAIVWNGVALWRWQALYFFVSWSFSQCNYLVMLVLYPIDVKIGDMLIYSNHGFFFFFLIMLSFQFSQWLSYSNPHIKILYAWNWLHCDSRSFCAAHFFLLVSKLMLLFRKEVGLLILSLAWCIPRQWSPLLLQSLLSAQWRQELQLR